MKSKTYSFGIIRIRQRGKKYYVYIIEKDKDGQRRDHYVDPLDKIVKTYLALGVLEGPPTQWTGRDLNPGPLGCKPSTLPG